MRPTSRHPFRAAAHFNIRYICSMNSTQTMGFCVRIVNVLLHGAEMQSIVCIWNPHLGLLDRYHPRDVRISQPMLNTQSCKVDRLDHSYPSFHLHVGEILHISESLRAHRLRARCCTTTYTPIYPPHRFLHSLSYCLCSLHNSWLVGQ